MRTQKLVYALCLGLALAWSPSAQARCDTVTDSTNESTCVADVMLKGNRYTCYDLSNTAEILRKQDMYPRLLKQVESLSMINVLHKQESDELRNAVRLLQSTQADLQRRAALADEEAKRAKAELATYPRWYKSPLFWGIVMFVAGAAIQNACCSGR